MSPRGPHSTVRRSRNSPKNWPAFATTWRRYAASRPPRLKREPVMADTIPPGPPVPPLEPGAKRYAAIDVGTNTIKVIVADLSKNGALRVLERSDTVRLGEGMQAQGNRLREIPMRRAVDGIAEFVEQARAAGAQAIAAVGTAALRDAENRDDL